MSVTQLEQVSAGSVPDPRWKNLYRIGYIISLIFPISIFLAVVAYFIWPFTPGFTSLANIFELLQSDRMAGLMSLDFMMVFLIPLMIPHLLALYVALKTVDESFALIALVFGLIANTLILVGRPWTEMVYLSDQYAAAVGDLAKSQYLAAGEAVHALFNGTVWMWWNILTGVSYLIFELLMLRSKVFSKATAYVGLALTITGFGIFFPALVFLSLLGTLISVVWYLMMARSFYRLGWGERPISPVH